MKHMNQADWDMHNNAINDWQEDAFQEDIILHRMVTTLSLHGEDNNIVPEDIPLKGLVQYNVFRSWPIDQATDTGEIDKQSCMVFLNKKWLRDQGLNNTDDELEYDPAVDRFSIKGTKYMPAGDSDIAQSHDNPLLFFIILKREEVNTGSQRYNKT